MPTPVSTTSKAMRGSPPSMRLTFRVTDPFRVNFTALPTRLNSAWRRRLGSARIRPRSGASTRSSRPLCSAWPRSSRATLIASSEGSTASDVTSSRPASIREKSITSSSRVDSIRPQARASPSRWSASPGSFSRLSRCITPSTPFIGVRISWLMFARNWALASLAAWAARSASTKASSARFFSSISRIRPNALLTRPPESRRTSWKIRIHFSPPPGVTTRTSNERPPLELR